MIFKVKVIGQCDTFEIVETCIQPEFELSTTNVYGYGTDKCLLNILPKVTSYGSFGLALVGQILERFDSEAKLKMISKVVTLIEINDKKIKIETLF